MTITFFNNWNTNKEFILLEISYANDCICLALLGLGIIITI